MDPEFLDVPPAEAVRRFRAKGLHVSHHWRDTSVEEHLVSFSAAKVATLDVARALKEGVDRTIAEGITFETFAGELEPKLVSLGWWGKQPMLDPKTGVTEIVQTGSVRRLRTIFDTNLRMSYSRGRWERMQRQARTRPYLRYVAVLDARTRPDHLRWHGTVLPIDHPFWETHYPPCGWFCRCTVIQLSIEGLEEFGWQVTEPPEGWDRTRTWYDRRNDREVQVPVGVDPGFERNVGMIDPVRDGFRRLNGRLAEADPAIAQASIRETLSSELFRDAFGRGDTRGWPVGLIPGDIRDALPEAYRDATGLVASRIPRGKLARKHPEVGPEEIRAFQDALDRGEILLETFPDKRRTSLVVYAPRGAGDEKTWWTWAVKLDETRGAWGKLVTVFPLADEARLAKLGSGRVTVLRRFDAARWESEG